MNAELQALVWQARRTAAGDIKIDLLEQAVALADQLGDLESAFDIRDDLTEAANEWGRPEKELVAFTWMLAQFDRDPQTFSSWDHKLMWVYKRVLSTLVAFPSIPLSRIGQAFADFKMRLEQSNRSQSTYDEYAVRNALQIGDAAQVETAYAQFKRHSRAADLDCRACQLHLEVRYRVFRGEDELALEAAAPLFKRGAQSCNRVPHSTRALILEPLLRLGRLGDAAVHHLDYKRVAGDEGFLNVIGSHLAYLGYVNDISNALKLLEKHLAWAFKTNDLADRYSFLNDTLPLLTRLRTAQPRVNLRLGREFPALEESGEYDTASLETLIHNELARVAALFDERNGNDFHVRKIGVDQRLLESINAPAELPTPASDKQATKKKPAQSTAAGKLTR